MFFFGGEGWNCIFGGANLLLFGQSRICVFSVLCGCCVGAVSYTSWAMYGCRVNEVSYPCRAMYGCRVGALRSLEERKVECVSQSEKKWIILVYAKKILFLHFKFLKT